MHPPTAALPPTSASACARWARGIPSCWPACATLAFLAAHGFGPAAGAADEVLVALPRFEVRDNATGDARYNPPSTRAAMKTETALLDVPQSLTAVTAEQIREQSMTSLGDVVRYVPGVGAHQGENNRDQLIFRGNSSSADFFVNGVRDDTQYYRDLYNLDRVEILRGPNAMIFGRGGGGGVVNRVTKEADFVPRHEFTLAGGSFGAVRGTLDVNQPLRPGAAVRLNGLVENAGSFRRGVALHRRGVNPTLTLAGAQGWRMTLGVEYLRDARTADRGVPSWRGRPASVPREAYFGDAADSFARARVVLASGLAEYRTPAGWELRERFLVGDYDRGYQNFVPGAVSADGTQVALSAYNNATRRRNMFSQTDAVRRFAGAVPQTLLVGAEIGRQATANLRQTGYFDDRATVVQVPLAGPSLAGPVTWRPSPTDAHNRVEAGIAAVYVQDQLELGRHWRAVAGGRLEAFSLRYENRRAPVSLRRRDVAFSPRAGLIFKPGPSVAIYGSRSQSFLPGSGDQFASLTDVTRQLEPERFTNHELGLKWDLPRDLILTLATYRLDRTNTRATDPNDPARIVQTGSQRSQGWELGLQGTFAQGWTGSAGYALQDATIRSRTTAAAPGAAVAQVPRHAWSAWNRVRLTSGLELGLGLVGRTAMYAAVDNTVVLPGYTRIDAAVFQTINRHWRAQLNVENLASRNYHVNADGNTNLSPGAPRTVRLALTYRR